MCEICKTFTCALDAGVFVSDKTIVLVYVGGGGGGCVCWGGGVAVCPHGYGQKTPLMCTRSLYQPQVL